MPAHIHPLPFPKPPRLLHCVLFLSALLLSSTWSAPPPTSDSLRDHLLVVYNQNEPESLWLARYYAKKRGIPQERLLGIDTPSQEEINRETYQKTIHEPINAYLLAQDWIERESTTVAIHGKVVPLKKAIRNHIWAIVLIRGIPLKIRQDPTAFSQEISHPVLQTNAASVDSELATLPILNLPINGMVPNPYFLAGYPRPFDQEDALQLILVTRLDGPSTPVVQRMIDESLHAEKYRLTGRALFDFQGENSPAPQGEAWIQEAYDAFLKEGWSVEADNYTSLMPEGLPLNDIGFYTGWYSPQAHGPFLHPPRRFTPGAIAYHIHSFSAASLRDPQQGWAAPFLAAGAAATMGSVEEPFLDLTPHIDRFAKGLLQQYTFAEAAYMSQKALSWMITFVGDPLYRPFRLSLEEATQPHLQHPLTDWTQLHAAQKTIRQTTTSSPHRLMRKYLLQFPKSSLFWEAYGDLLAQTTPPTPYTEIVEAYQIALQWTNRPLDQTRLQQKLTQLPRPDESPSTESPR